MICERGFEEFDDISCEFRTGGELRTHQLAKHVVYKRGPWAMILFLAQYRSKGTVQAPHYIVSKWTHRAGRWRKHSSVSLRNGQATKALAVVAGWEASCCELEGLGIDVGASIQSAVDGVG